jgi:outer membrane protein OmpA-like peptidoglycan-associated protein
MNKYRLGSAAVATLLAFATAAGAQTSPSADQIINALKPTPQALRSAVTRGIRPIAPGSTGDSDVVQASTTPAKAPTAKAPAPTVTASATPAAATAHEAPAEAPSVNLYVPFEYGSAELTPQAIAALDELGKALTSSTLSGFKFKIEGHTDTVGTKAYNMSLSERRAAAVSAYLEQKYGVKQDRLETVGLGESHLLVPTPDQTPEPRNRRVTVVNLGA